jgi:RimJ/RimL family protein N-acetyltransferase
MNNTFPTSVPLLQTERFTLREYRRADFDAFAAHLMDPESSAFFGSSDRPTAWRIFSSQAGLWLIDGAGWWAVENRHTGQLVGNIGAFFREDVTAMEVGWNTYRAFWGQGIAVEAGAAVLDHVFDIRREPKVRALITPANVSSRRVAERLGMTYEMETELHGKVISSYMRER